MVGGGVTLCHYWLPAVQTLGNHHHSKAAKAIPPRTTSTTCFAVFHQVYTHGVSTYLYCPTIPATHLIT